MRRFDAPITAWAALLSAATLVSGTGVRAQASSVTPPQSQANKIDIEVIADLIYDSNIAHSGAFLAQRRGILPSDESFRPSVSVNLGHRLGRQTLFLQGSLGYDFNRRNHILNRERIDLHPGVLLNIGRCGGSFAADYGRHQTDLANLALVNHVPELNIVKNAEDTEKLEGSATCGSGVGLAPTFDVYETWTHNSSSRLKFAASRSFSATAGLAYRQPVLGRVNLFGNFVRTDFPNRPVIGFGADLVDGYDIYSGGLSFDRHIGARLDATVSMNYTSLKPRIPTSPGFKGFAYSANATYQFDPRLEVQFTLSRATLPSSRVGATFSVNNTLSGEFDYRVSPRLTLKVGGSHVHRSYPGALGTVIDDLTKETVNSEFGDATYRLNRRVSLGLNVTHVLRDANFSQLSYTGNRVAFSVRSAF